MITEEQLSNDVRTVRKLILIENLEELDLKPKKKREFIEYYYNNLDLNLLDALEKFKSIK